MERLDRFVFTHRRLLAAACAGIATLCTISALTRAETTQSVVVAADDIPAGTPLTTDSLRLAELSAGAVPDTAVDAISDVVGRTVTGPIGSGEILTTTRILDTRDLSDYGVSDPSLATIRVADPAILTTLHIGDRVDVLTADSHDESGPVIVAEDVVVASLPTTESQSDVVGLVGPAQAAATIASTALSSGLTLVTS